MPLTHGILGDLSQQNQLAALAPQHRLGSAPPPAGASPAGPGRPRGGQNPAVPDGFRAGRTARNSNQVGASDAVSDINSRDNPTPVEPLQCCGSPVCDCECPKKSKPTLLLAGQWGQSWGDFYQSAIGTTFVQPAENWPGSECFTYDTCDVGSGPWPAIGLVYLSQGQVALVHRYSESSSGLSLAVKCSLRILLPGNPSWTQVEQYQFPLTQERDQAVGEYVPDSNVFYDANTQKITIFPRQDREIPFGAPGTLEATVLTADLAVAPAIASPAVGVVQVNTVDYPRFTATAMNVAGPYMIKGNLAENLSTPLNARAFVYTYTADSQGIWSNTAPINWMQELLDSGFLEPVSDGSSRPAYVAGDGRIVGIGPEDTFDEQNRGLPWIQADNNNRWCGLVSALRLCDPGATPVAGDYDEAKILELQFPVEGNSLAALLEIFVQESYSQQQAQIMANAIQEAAASVPQTFPLYQPYSFTETRTQGCACQFPPCGPEYGPHTYQFTSDRVWLGAVYQSEVLEGNYWNGSIAPGDFQYFPYPGNQDHVPLRHPQNAMGVRRIRPGDGYISTPNGSRYGTLAIPRPYLLASSLSLREVPANSVISRPVGLTQESSPAGIVSRSSPLLRREPFGACSFLVHTRELAGYAPAYSFAEETVMFSVTSSGVVSLLPIPGQRHEFHSGDPEVPIAEKVFQVIVLEELDRAFWLHGYREARECATSAPMISVTAAGQGLDGGVLWTIPASQFFPLTRFESDQVYEGPNLDNPIWAQAGEYRHVMLGQNGSGPLMKLVRRQLGAGFEYYLLLGTEHYERVEPREAGGIPWEDVFDESQSQGDGRTYNLNKTPVVLVTAAYRNSDPGDPLGYTVNGDQVILDDPLPGGDTVNITYTYGDPTASVGQTVGQSFVIRISADGYTVAAQSQQAVNWTYPNLEPALADGQNIIRRLAVGPDRIAYITEDAGGRKIRQVL